MATVINGDTGVNKVQDDAVNPVTCIASGIPCFSAYQSVSQNLSAGTWTKLNFQTKEFDTTNAFDNITSMRFQPTVPGYYMVIIGIFSPNGSVGILQTGVYKNGVAYKYGNTDSTSGTITTVNQSCIVYLNGSSDYVEAFGYAQSASSIGNSSSTTYFQAHLIVGA